MHDSIALVYSVVSSVASDSLSAPLEAPPGIMGFFAQYGSLLLMGLALVAVYFIFMRPNKKKEKEAAAKRDNIEVGDEITTIGGVLGRVVNVKDDNFVIETGGDRTRMRFKKWAIQDVNKLELETPGDGLASAGDTSKDAPKKDDKAKK